MVDVTSVDYFNVVAIGKVSKSVVKCVGSCKGKCFFSLNLFNFFKKKELNDKKIYKKNLKYYN